MVSAEPYTMLDTHVTMRRASEGGVGQRRILIRPDLDFLLILRQKLGGTALLGIGR